MVYGCRAIKMINDYSGTKRSTEEDEISACELSLLGEIFFVPFKYTTVARGSINHGFVAL